MSQSTPTQHEIDVYAGEYVLTGDKSKSWRKTFPKSKAKDSVIWTNAQKMHSFPLVLERIKELQSEQSEKDKKEFDLSAAEIKELLAKAVKLGFAENIDAHGNVKPAALAPAVSALSEINRMNGNHAAEKREHSGSLEISRVERVIVDPKD